MMRSLFSISIIACRRIEVASSLQRVTTEMGATSMPLPVPWNLRNIEHAYAGCAAKSDPSIDGDLANEAG